MLVYVKFMVDEVALGQDFLSVFLLSPVNIIPLMLHTHFHLHVAVTRKKIQGLGTFQKAKLFGKSGNSGEKNLFIVS